nr:hypothetical protein SHINE37_30117 [Rhizobiaceae bacterium]
MSGMPRGPCRLRAPRLARAHDASDRERTRRDREPIHNAGGNRGIGAAVQVPAFKSIRPLPVEATCKTAPHAVQSLFRSMLCLTRCDGKRRATNSGCTFPRSLTLILKQFNVASCLQLNQRW